MQQIALPPGGLPGVRPFSGLLEKPQGVREKVGTPGVFLLKAAPGREEGNLSYKWGGGRLLARGVEPIKRRARDEKGTFQE